MYAAKQDMIDRFGELEMIQLTDRSVPPAAIDEAVLGRALDDAGALIGGYLAKLYSLPPAAVPERLVRVEADIARYYLTGEAASKDGPVRLAYDDALSWLRDVSRGLVVLEIDGLPAAQPEGGTVRVSGPARVMSRDSLRGL